jgi:hypothetical protein
VKRSAKRTTHRRTKPASRMKRFTHIARNAVGAGLTGLVLLQAAEGFRKAVNAGGYAAGSGMKMPLAAWKHRKHLRMKKRLGLRVIRGGKRGLFL